MTIVRVHFSDSTPDLDLRGVMRIEFKDGMARWQHMDRRVGGLKWSKYQIEQIAYVTVATE